MDKRSFICALVLMLCLTTVGVAIAAPHSLDQCPLEQTK